MRCLPNDLTDDMLGPGRYDTCLISSLLCSYSPLYGCVHTHPPPQCTYAYPVTSYVHAHVLTLTNRWHTRSASHVCAHIPEHSHLIYVHAHHVLTLA